MKIDEIIGKLMVFIDEIQNEPDDENNVMIPPLQQKLELLKKVSGEKSVFDEPDELSDIQQLSGVKPIIIHLSSEDNDITP